MKMVEFNWVIIEDLANHEWDTDNHADELLYVDGFLEMRLNQRKQGFIPDMLSGNKTIISNTPFAGWWNLLEYFHNFTKVFLVQPYRSFVFRPMDDNLIEYVFYRETGTLSISLRRRDDLCVLFEEQWAEAQQKIRNKEQWKPHPVKWTEKVSYAEFCLEVKKNIEQFLKVIGDANPEMLETRCVKEIYADRLKPQFHYTDRIPAECQYSDRFPVD